MTYFIKNSILKTGNMFDRKFTVYHGARKDTAEIDVWLMYQPNIKQILEQVHIVNPYVNLENVLFIPGIIFCTIQVPTKDNTFVEIDIWLMEKPTLRKILNDIAEINHEVNLENVVFVKGIVFFTLQVPLAKY